MVRTVISLDEADKRWLDQQAALQHVPMTEVVRQAIQSLRAAGERGGKDFPALLEATAGIWSHGDGLDWQRSVRDEWAR